MSRGLYEIPATPFLASLSALTPPLTRQSNKPGWAI